jgi:hypothetical protein
MVKNDLEFGKMTARGVRKKKLPRPGTLQSLGAGWSNNRCVRISGSTAAKE